MTINSEIIENYTKSITISKGELYVIKSPDAKVFIVLASSDSGQSCRGEGYFSGVVINSQSSWPVGHFSETWLVESFKPFYGEILISSE